MKSKRQSTKLLLLIIGLISIPLLLFASLRQQDLRQKAASNLISNVMLVTAQPIPLYDKFEVSFAIDTTASNPQFPYDEQELTGLTSKVGVTVDGLFLPPGESDWSKALIQPAFLYAEALDVGRGINIGMALTGKEDWRIRFAPQQKGEWMYKIRFQDASTAPLWEESQIMTFTATDPREGERGFLKVSETDPRYFSFSDGTPFLGQGLNIGVWKDTLAKFPMMGQHKADFHRFWMSMMTIHGRGTHGWNAWYIGGLNRPMEGRTDWVTKYQDHDFSYKLDTNTRFMYQYSNGNQPITGALQQGKTYKVRARVKFTDFIVAAGGKGLVVRLDNGNTGTSPLVHLLQSGPNTNTDWQIVEATYTHTRPTDSFHYGNTLVVALEDVTGGSVNIDEIFIGEELAGGTIGPNIVFKGNVAYHLNFDQIASAYMDEVVKKAEEANIYLRPVVYDKNDELFSCMKLDGTNYTSYWDCSGGRFNNNFYAEPNTKVRRLHQYYWRYLIARWGYSTAIHSYDLLNEGDPFNGRHREMAQSFAKFMKEKDPQRHLANTSTWHSYPLDFWNSTTTYPDIPFGIFHGYNSPSGAMHFPNVTSLNNPQIINDMALFHTAYSDFAATNYRNKPIARTEGGIFQNVQDLEDTAIALDTNGVWLHTFLWSQVHHGALHDLYWYPENSFRKSGKDGSTVNGLFEHYKDFADFMLNIPFANGTYQAITASVSDTTTKVYGQANNKNSPANKAHVWIYTTQYTWRNVVNNVSTGRLQGTVTLSGFVPNQTFPVEYWEFDRATVLTKRTATLSSTADGSISISLNALQSTTTDVGVKIGTYTIAPTGSLSPTISNTPSLTPTVTITPTVQPSITVSPTPSITRTPTPTATRTPSPTQPVPTATSVSTSTRLNLSMLLHGIGLGGDNVSPGSVGTLNPLRPERVVTVELYDANNQLILSRSGTILFANANGNFTGTVEIGNVTSGLYIVKVVSPQYLRRTVPGIISISQGQYVILPQVALITGNANNDGLLNLLDYNILLDCYSDLSPARNCADTTKRTMADLTDDGAVNIYDLNLFLRELSVQTGE